MEETPTISEPEKDWPHAPIHRLDECGTYIITAATHHKHHIFNSPQKLTLLENHLLSIAKQSQWQLEAWAVFANHYHFVARSLPGAVDLGAMIKTLHANTARELNQMDQTVGRKVWFNFWDTKLTYQQSYFARLNYVHQNPVKHRLVPVASQYRWCSASWFERVTPSAMINTIYGFKIDKVNIRDEF
jgi:putative transposase